MVRSRHQLVERLALVFHDWFATSNDAVGSARLMLDQTNVFRANGLGSFKTMVRAITQDPAMILFLDLASNRKGAINENYGRELMELFTLGADRGAYTENDVRELARSLSGWDYDWSAELGVHNFHWDEAEPLGPGLQDRVRQDRALDVGGRRRAWSSSTRSTRRSSSRSCGATSSRRAPDAGTAGEARAALRRARATRSGRCSRRSSARPSSTTGPRMVKPPTVFVAGMLRARERGITSNSLELGALRLPASVLYYPPDVSGWDDKRWLDTNTTLGRWEAVVIALEGDTADPGRATTRPRRPNEALDAGARLLGRPERSRPAAWPRSTRSPAPRSAADAAADWQRASRQNALRQLIAGSPDYQTS